MGGAPLFVGASGTERNPARSIKFVLLVGGLGLLPVSASAQSVKCLYQGAILDRSADWCSQNGQASVASGTAAAGSVDAIKLLQMRLASAGLNPGPVDGYIGPSTSFAIREFQRQAGMTVDGKISDELNEKLANAADQKAKEWQAKNTPAASSPQRATAPATTSTTVRPLPPVVQKPVGSNAATTPPLSASTGSPTAGLVIIGALLGAIGLGVAWIWRSVARWRLRRRIGAELAAVTEIPALEPVLNSLTERQLRSVWLLRQQWYEQALKGRMHRGVLSDEATAEMDNCRRALRLDESDIVGAAVLLARQGLADATNAKDVSAVFARMTDGQRRACLGERQDYFRTIVRNRIKDESLSDGAFEEVKAYQKALDLDDIDIGNTGLMISRAQELYHIRNGQIPALTSSPILIQAGEKLYFTCRAKLIEQKVIARHTVGGSRGVSIRLMRGVSYRVGAYRGKSVSERGPVVVSEGDFCLTSERVVFSGNEKSFSVSWEKLLSINVASNGAMLSPTSGATRMLAFEQNQDAEMMIAILNAVYRRQNSHAAIVAA